MFSYLEAEGVGEDEGQDVFGKVGDGYQEGGFGKVHACEEGELEGSQEVAGGEAGEAGSGTKEFVFQGGSGSAQEGEEEEAPDEAACFSGNDGETAGKVGEYGDAYRSQQYIYACRGCAEPGSEDCAGKRYGKGLECDGDA